MTVLRHLGGYAPVKLTAALTSFGGIFVFTRLLSPSEYGRYALMFSVMALLHLLTLTWVEAAAFRFGGKIRTEEDRRNHFRTAMTLLGLSSLMALVLAAALTVIVWDQPQYRAFLPWIAVLMPANTLVKIAMEAHRAEQRVRRYAFSAIIKLLMGFFAGILLAWLSGLGAVAPIAGLVCGAVVGLALEGRSVITKGRKGRTDRETLRCWMIFGIPASFAFGLDLILSSADRFLIAVYLDEASVGAYAAGYGVADKTVMLVMGWAALAMTPLLMRAYESGDNSELRRRLRDFAKVLLVVGLPVATGIALVSGPLSEAMIGEPLRDAARQIIPWIAFSGLLNGFAAIYFAESFQLTRRTSLRAGLMLFPIVVNIGLNILLIPTFGLMGAVWATALSYAIACLLLGSVARSILPMPVPIKDVMQTVLACTAMLPILYVDLGMGAWVDLFFMSALGAMMYSLAQVLMNFELARQWLSKRPSSDNF
ncbi:hypothetical protein GCM10007853_21150 [Algimonas ampicilliniresistens]|uniref:Lipopolysaccharide biosynthesis protein n=1 Tax=Algimonas ampicilliniresistens TaxID=1298735 RepID=A0ABQ5V9M0_9PROT|nr:lipopolysaccharide biosynthesis protein [Algimonas ampicilliniresistens]GLQ24241.1 hypothetical protein GCM10007853_21150 [Algimonas ampicilliniresistens]